MLEVFFSEAAKYSMKAAMQDNQNLINSDSEEVIFVGSHLDIGYLSSNLSDYERLDFINELFNNQTAPAKLEKLAENQQDEKNKLLRAAKAGVTIRIWKSESAFSAAGFAYVCEQLKDIPVDIRVVSLKNPVMTTENLILTYNHWGEVNFTATDSYQATERKLSALEKKNQAKLWEKLKGENSPLRAMVDGQLVSVPEDFYDHLLIKHFPQGEFVVADLIAKVLGAYPLAASDSWYLYRIQQMIQNEKLEIVDSKNKNNLYAQKLKQITSA